MSLLELTALVRRIADHRSTMPLGAGNVIDELLPLIREVERHLLGASVPDVVRDALLAGLLLRAGDLDAAHQRAQAHEGDPRCDHWHAMMHRREGDFWNSAYWYRRVGARSALPRGWSPIEFGDRVKACLESGRSDPAGLIAEQRREWQTLMAACAESCGITFCMEES